MFKDMAHQVMGKFNSIPNKIRALWIRSNGPMSTLGRRVSPRKGSWIILTACCKAVTFGMLLWHVLRHPASLCTCWMLILIDHQLVCRKMVLTSLPGASRLRKDSNGWDWLGPVWGLLESTQWFAKSCSAKIVEKHGEALRSFMPLFKTALSASVSSCQDGACRLSSKFANHTLQG